MVGLTRVPFGLITAALILALILAVTLALVLAITRALVLTAIVPVGRARAITLALIGFTIRLRMCRAG